MSILNQKKSKNVWLNDTIYLINMTSLNTTHKKEVDETHVIYYTTY